MLELLDDREVACQAEHDRLQAEAERIGGLLAVCRIELERLVTAREVVGQLAAAHPAVVAVPAGSAGLATPGADVAAFTERVLAVLAEGGRAMRCHEVVAALGEDASVAQHVERVRHRLKKLRTAGRVAEITPGLFTLPRAMGTAKG